VPADCGCRNRVRTGDAGGEGIASGIAKEHPMTNPSKPVLLFVMPRQLPRPVLAVAVALVGVALTGMHTLALGASASLQTCTTSGDFCTTGRLVLVVSLCWCAAFAAIAGLVSLRKPGRRPRPANPMVLACIVLAAFIAAGAGTWMAIGANSSTGTVPSITDAFTQPTQFQ